MKTMGLLILLACVMIPDNINTQLINFGNSYFHSYSPLNYDISAADEINITSKTFPVNTRYDCENICSAIPPCLMISFKPELSTKCKVYAEIKFTLSMPLSRPSLYQKEILDFSTFKSNLIVFWSFNGQFCCTGDDVLGFYGLKKEGINTVADRFGRLKSAFGSDPSKNIYGLSRNFTEGGSPISLNTDFTITGWVFLNSYNYNTSVNMYPYPTFNSNLFTISGKTPTDFWITFSLSSPSQSSNALGVYLNNGNSTVFNHTSTTILSLNRWYHVTYIKKAYTSSIYVNTILVSEQTSPFLAYAGLFNSLTIGNVNGSLDDIKLFNKALDNYEICENYNSKY